MVRLRRVAPDICQVYPDQTMTSMPRHTPDRNAAEVRVARVRQRGMLSHSEGVTTDDSFFCEKSLVMWGFILIVVVM